MDLYFMRHAVAVDPAEWQRDDSARPLTPEGRWQATMAGEAMACLGLRFASILTSPLARARETAELVAHHLQATDRLQEDLRLAPGFDRDRLHALVRTAPSGTHLLLVGHEPDFSQTVSALIGGGTLVIKPGGLARIELTSLPPLRGHAPREELRDGSQELKGELVWLAPPILLRPSLR